MQSDPINAVDSSDEQIYDAVCSLLVTSQSIDNFLSIPLPHALHLKESGPQAPQPSDRLKARYLIQSSLAEGGSASVFIASDEILANRLVVVKVLNQIDEPEIVKELITAEIHSLARIRHPNLRGILDLGETDSGLPFLVLEYIAGESLRQLIARRQPIAPERINRLLAGIVEALAEAHRYGIIHLDLKPENIIITDPGLSTERAVVIDFGISALNVHPGTTSRFKQSPYSDPQATSPPTPAADIFSLARVLEELYACGPENANPQVPARISNAITRATTPELLLRYASVTDFGTACTQPTVSRWATFAFVLAIASIILISILLTSQSPSDPWKRLDPKPFITEKGSHRDIAYSSDGKSLFYATGLEGDFALFQTPIDRFAPKLAVAHLSSEFQPYPSPDGRWLLFSRSTSGAFELLIKPLSGDGPERLLARFSSTPSYTWLNDSSGLLLSVKEFESQPWCLYRLRLDSPRLQPLFKSAPDPADDQFPATDPATKLLAFVRRVHGKGDYIYTVPIGQEGLPIATPRLLTIKPSKLGLIRWANNGKTVLVHNDPYRDSTLNAIAFPSGSIVPLKLSLAGMSGFALHSKAKSMAIIVTPSEQNIYRLQLSPGPARLLNPVAASSLDEEEASYSQDGKFIAFTSTRSGKPQAWIAARDGSSPRQITEFQESFSALTSVISSNSRSLYLSTRSVTGQIATYIVDLETPSQPKLFLADGFICSLSRDGAFFYFYRKIASVPQIFRAPVKDPQFQTQVTKTGGTYALESLASDRLYFTTRNENEGLHYLPLPLNGISIPGQTPVSTLFRRSLFVPAQNGLYLIRKDELNLPPGLFFLAQNSEVPKLLYRFDRTVQWGLNLSPSQTELLVTLQDVSDQSVYLTKIPD